MQEFTLKLSREDLDVLLIALIDEQLRLLDAIRNERVCSNNSDTIEKLQSDRTRIDGIRNQLSQQEKI